MQRDVKLMVLAFVAVGGVMARGTMMGPLPVPPYVDMSIMAGLLACACFAACRAWVPRGDGVRAPDNS